MNTKIIFFFILILFNSIVYTQTLVKSVTVWYYANGQEEALSNIAPSSQVTIERDPGSSLKIRIDKVSSAGTVEYWYSTYSDGGGDTKSTTAAYWYFSDIGNNITSLITAGINNNDGAVRISVQDLETSQPNLTVISAEVNNSTSSYQKEFFVGERVRVECDVWNNGGATAGSSRLGYYIGVNQNDLTNRWDYDPTSSLASTHSESEYEYYTFTNNDIGTRYFIYKADYQDVVDESSESDNVESWGPFTVSPQPLQITITAPSNDLIITQGDEVNISWEASGPNSPTVSLKYDSDQTWDNSNEHNLAFQQPLASTYTWNTSNVEPGVYYIAGMVDDGNDSEYDYAPGKITIETQTPSIEMNLYKISDTEGKANSNTPGNEKAVFYPGETVRITFSASNTNMDANVQCILNIRGVDNSTTVYDSDALGENNYNDSPLQTGETDYYSFDYTIPLNSDRGYFDIGGAIRDLNDFEILYETTAAGPNSVFNGDNWILSDLFQVVPQEYTYGTTIITHGHSPDNNEYAPWQEEMAQAIANRIENAEIRLYNHENGEFELLDSKGSGAEKILIFDWADASNQHGQGYSVAASNALFTSLIQGDKDGVIDLSKPKHFIGHSRGTVINSECAKRLLYFGFSVEHITNLDPHDWGLATLFGQAGQFDDLYINDDIDIEDPPSIYSNSNSGVVSWKDIGFIDTYYQDGGIGDLGGRKVIGSYNVNLPNTLGHNDIVTWYLGTIDYTSGNNEWFNIEYDGNHIPTRNGTGYNYSRFGQIEKPDNNLDDRHELNYDISKDLLANSTFNYSSTLNELLLPALIVSSPSTPGWTFFGGTSRNGAQVLYGELRLGTGDLYSGDLAESITSNRFFLPNKANEINIKYKIRDVDSGEPPNVDKFRVILIGKNYSTIVFDDFWLNEYVPNYNDLRFAIPEEFKDNIVRIKLEIVRGGWAINTRITIDEIRVVFDETMNTKPFTPVAISPSDGSFIQNLTPTFEWSQFQDGGDHDPQSGYQLRVRDDENDDNIIYDTGFIESVSDNSHTYSPGAFYGNDPVTGQPRYSEALEWEKHYHWHVRYMDNNGDWSDWSADDPNPHQNFFTQPETPLINVNPQSLVINELSSSLSTNPISREDILEGKNSTINKYKNGIEITSKINSNSQKGEKILGEEYEENSILSKGIGTNDITAELLENQFEVKNIGTADLTVSEIISNQTWLSSDFDSPITLNPGENKIITVQVTWDELTESSTGLLTVKSNDPNNPEGTVSVTANPIQLLAPVANSATEITTTSFRANWTKVDWATGYRIDVATNDSFTEFLLDWKDKYVGNSYTATIDDLSPNTTYYYRVRGVKDNYTSENSNKIEVQTLPLEQVVSTPTFDPPSGTQQPVSVKINCETSEAEIRYTTDGSDPTTSSTLFSSTSPIPLNSEQEVSIKAKAWKSGYTASEVVSATYPGKNNDNSLLSNLYSYYNFNNNLSDEFGVYDLTNHNTSFKTGKINEAVEFLGSSTSYLDTETKSGFAFLHDGTDFTISCWIYHNNTASTNHTILGSFIGADQKGIQLSINQNNIYFTVGRSWPYPVVSAVWNDVLDPIHTTWTHILITHNGTNPNNQYSLYVNGQLKGTASKINEYLSGESYYPLRIGINKTSQTIQPFLGKIDEMGFWKRTLSQNEILSLYNNGNGLAYPFTDQSEQPKINVTPQSLVINELTNQPVPTSAVKANSINEVKHLNLKNKKEISSRFKKKESVVQDIQGEGIANGNLKNSAGNNELTSDLLPNQFEIINTGTADLTVLGIEPNKTWLSSDSNSPFILAPGSSKIITVEVTWDALTETSNGILTVESNDLNKPEVPVNVTVNPIVEYQISGKVSLEDNSGLSGVTLNFSNNGGSVITDENGNYSNEVIGSWEGTVTPIKDGYTFDPPSMEYKNVTSNVSNQDYLSTKNSDNKTIIARINTPEYVGPNQELTAEIEVDLTNHKIDLLGSFTAKIYYDVNKTEYISNSGLLSNFSGLTPIIDQTSGTISFNGLNIMGVGGAFPLIEFTFKAIGAINELLEFQLTFSVLGSTQTFDDLLPYLIIENGVTEIQLLGTIGDVNSDENCNSTDALIILSHDVGISIPQNLLDNINLGLGDVNNDGFTNSTDALIILSADVGINIPFEICVPQKTIIINTAPLLNKKSDRGTK